MGSRFRVIGPAIMIAAGAAVAPARAIAQAPSAASQPVATPSAGVPPMVPNPPRPATAPGASGAVTVNATSAIPAPEGVSPGTAGAPPPPASRERPPRLDHEHQFGLAVMPGIGYKVIVPYEDNKTCGDSSGDDTKRVCTNTVPFFIDLQAAFGVSTRIDLMVDVRFGVAKDRVTSSRQLALAPGIRIWLDPDLPFKFYTTLQVLYDNTDQHQRGISDTDWGIRNSNGFMYDPIRNVGFYFQFGDSIGFKRWFRIELDAGLGVQVRFP